MTPPVERPPLRTPKQKHSTSPAGTCKLLPAWRSTVLHTDRIENQILTPGCPALPSLDKRHAIITVLQRRQCAPNGSAGAQLRPGSFNGLYAMEGTFRFYRFELADRRGAVWIDGTSLPKRRPAVSLESGPEGGCWRSCGLQRSWKGYPDRAPRPADIP